MNYVVTQEQARTILNEVVEDRGLVAIYGESSDNFLDPGYWEEAELEHIQNIVTEYVRTIRGQSPEQELKVVKYDSEATLPRRAGELDAGYDLTTIENFTLEPGQRRLVRTGIAVQPPAGHYLEITPRSGLAHEFGLSIVNSPGVVDEGYRGEVRVNLINLGQNDVWIPKHTRIAQAIVKPYYTPKVVEVEKLSETSRGTAGHGSTGAV